MLHSRTIAAALLPLALTGCLADGSARPLASAAVKAILGCGAPIALSAIASGGAPSTDALVSGGSCLAGALTEGPEAGRVRPEAELVELGRATADARVKIIAAREGTGSEADALAAVAKCESMCASR